MRRTGTGREAVRERWRIGGRGERRRETEEEVRRYEEERRRSSKETIAHKLSQC